MTPCKCDSALNTEEYFGLDNVPPAYMFVEIRSGIFLDVALNGILGMLKKSVNVFRDVSIDFLWMTFALHNVIHLPPLFRPNPSC